MFRRYLTHWLRSALLVGIGSALATLAVDRLAEPSAVLFLHLAGFQPQLPVLQPGLVIMLARTVGVAAALSGLAFAIQTAPTRYR